MERIRVLHPITRLIVGGAQENTMYTAALLDKSVYDVEILSGPQTGSEGSLIEEVRSKGIPLIIFPEMVRQISLINDFLVVWKLYKLIKTNHYTIIHTHSSKAGILGRFAAKLAHTSVIVHTVHGWSFHDHMSPAVKYLYITLEKWTSLFSDALIVVSEKDIEKGLIHGIGRREQYHLIRSSIPLDEFNFSNIDRLQTKINLGFSPDAVIIGNVGRFSEQKNPLDWIHIAGEISRLRPDVRFLLVGDGPLRTQVESEIKRLGLQGKTVLTGLRRDVANLMAVMDIFLLTSLWEGLPRVIPQAMAMHIPVIAYRIDGTSDAISHEITGYLADPGEINAMVNYCLNLIDDPEARKRIGAAGGLYSSQEFDLNVMIKRIDTLYQSLLAKPRIA